MRRPTRAARLRSAAIKAAYRTEAALCDAFATQARAEGFTVHAETSGWDLLLVRGDTQVGVQAKLRANLAVLVQALPPQSREAGDYPGPDVRAVLVPESNGQFGRIARELQLAVFEMMHQRISDVVARARLWDHSEHEWVPPCEITCVGGGRAGPVQITPWKVAAMTLCERVRRRGHVTRADFTSLKMSPSTWVRCGWLRVEKVDKQWRYFIGTEQLPDERWPDIARSLRSHQTGSCPMPEDHEPAVVAPDC